MASLWLLFSYLYTLPTYVLNHYVTINIGVTVLRKIPQFHTKKGQKGAEVLGANNL
jgi:hypothetical protein